VKRLPVPAPGDLRDDAAGLVAAIAAPGREAPATMAVLAYQPDLLAPFLGWAAALALTGVLPKRDHELLALRAAHNCGSTFEWTEHAAYARQAGFTDSEIAAIASPVEAGPWSDVARALLTAADELHKSSTVSDDTWAALAAHYDRAALVEILFVVGQYTMLSMFANAAGIE
jgi:alkylhydroperoxidase family enzyme